MPNKLHLIFNSCTFQIMSFNFKYLYPLTCFLFILTLSVKLTVYYIHGVQRFYHFVKCNFCERHQRGVAHLTQGSIKKYKENVAVYHIFFSKVILSNNTNFIDIKCFVPFDANVFLIPDFKFNMFCHHGAW